MQNQQLKGSQPKSLKGTSSFINLLHNRFQKTIKTNKTTIKALAKQANITDLNHAYEKAELAWALWYRKIIQENKDIKTQLQKATDFYYNLQPTFSQTSSTKKIYQQYSTAAPIALLAGWFVEAQKAGSVFEPSAGNGLLCIYAPYEKATVNELDATRLANLELQPFKAVLNQDALLPFEGYEKTQDAVLCNPPFGKLDVVNYDYDGFIIKKLDHLMIAHALATMKDTGRAALIIGGHTEYNAKGMIASFRPFFNWLYHHYQVLDMINIDSRKLYAKQGTAFPLRLILIAGRKEVPFGTAPRIHEALEIETEVSTFDALFQRVKKAKKKAAGYLPTLKDHLEIAIQQLNTELYAA